MEEVRLLGCWSSPFSRRVEMALKLKGVEYEYVEEDLVNKSQSLLHYNPIHKKVPVLIHNGKPIAESLVILEYIDETWRARYQLLPSDPYERAGARFWAKFISEQCMPTLWKACASSDGELMAEAVSHLARLEDELKGKRFFGGEAIGLVDLTAGLIAHWLPVIQEARGNDKLLITRESFPRLTKWSEEFCGVDGVRENLPDKEKMAAVFRMMFAPAMPNDPAKYVPKV
uniref:glutathione transferase n=1 Tax=Kalanchoe fedtschenkoi TaxID=63787 RepID=A0A7N0U9Z7_KALFE